MTIQKSSGEKDSFEIVSSNAPMKRVDPETDKGKNAILKLLNATETVFLNSISLHRGVSVETVKEDFGQGGLLVGIDAVNAGMADTLGSFEDTINELNGGTIMDITRETVEKDYPEIAEAFKQEASQEVAGIEIKLQEANATIAELKKSEFRTSLNQSISDSDCDMLMKIYNKCDNTLIIDIANRIAELQTIINDLGEQKGKTDVSVDLSDDAVNVAVTKIMEEENINETDAYVEFIKRTSKRS
jgi:hypothetical protein